MGRRGPRPAKHLAIANAALSLFVERSVKGATTRAIARRARSTEASLYRHYADKDALARHVLGTCLRLLGSELETGMAEAIGGRERLRAYVFAYAEFARRHPLEHAFLMQAQACDLFGMLEDCPRPRRILSSILGEGLATGEFPEADARWLAVFLAGGLGRLSQAAWGRGRERALAPSVEAVAAMVERVVGWEPPHAAHNGKAVGHDERTGNGSAELAAASLVGTDA